jgi:hypothetical protein
MAAPDWEIDGRVDCGKMHDLVSKRGGSRRTSERAGSHESAAPGPTDSGRDPRDLPSSGADLVSPHFRDLGRDSFS